MESAAQIEIASQFPLVSANGDPLLLERAVDLAVAQHPTLDGYRLVHVPFDDALGGAWDQDRSVQNTRRAIRGTTVVGIIGPWSSYIAHFTIPITQPADMVVLSPSNSLECLTLRPEPCLAHPTPIFRTNYFRIEARDTVTARASAAFAVRRLGIQRIAILVHPYQEDSIATANAFADEFARVGGSVVFAQSYPLTGDFVPLLREAYHAGAQAVYAPVVGDACAMRRQMSGIFPTSAYLISWDQPAVEPCLALGNMVGATDDHMVLTMSTAQPPEIPTVLSRLINGHGDYMYVFAAYDCAHLLIDAIDRAIKADRGKIPTREQVREAVAATANFRGITGTYSFDANGDVMNPGFSFYTLNQGAWSFWRNP